MSDENRSRGQMRMHAILRGFREAPEPAKPVEVKRLSGTRWQWVCPGCSTLCIGEPARREGRSWYCPDC